MKAPKNYTKLTDKMLQLFQDLSEDKYAAVLALIKTFWTFDIDCNGIKCARFVKFYQYRFITVNLWAQ